MCKQIKNYFEMVVSDKHSIVVLPNEYKGSPMLCYSPKILITNAYVFNKYRSSILIDMDITRVVFVD